jgi:hypothetical protein
MTITTPATIGATTHARPSRPRYGPSVPTFVVGLRPGGRTWNRLGIEASIGAFVRLAVPWPRRTE